MDNQFAQHLQVLPQKQASAQQLQAELWEFVLNLAAKTAIVLAPISVVQMDVVTLVVLPQEQ